MIVDRSHLGWGLATFAATVGVTVVYLANNAPEQLPVSIPLPAWLGPVPPLRANAGATPLGFIYGCIALAIFIFAALFGWRRNRSTWKIGRIKAWLRAHIWLTVFTVPLVLLHCGFQGGGPMTEFLLGLYAFVMLSGFWGLALQNIVPVMMRARLQEEVIFEQIPYIRGHLLEQAQAVLKKMHELLTTTESGLTETREEAAPMSVAQAEALASCIQFLEREALGYLQAPAPRGLRLNESRRSDDHFRLQKLQAPESIWPAIEQMQSLCDEKRRLDLQTRLHFWLHSWLLVHAPASLLLVVLTVWHAIVATLYYA